MIIKKRNSLQIEVSLKIGFNNITTINIKAATTATNMSNLQKYPQLVLLVDSLRKQSIIGTQGANDQQNVIIYNFVQRA